MRNFALINAEGNRWDLNDLDSFLHDPTNLGMERKIKYEQMGYEFVVINEILAQKKPKGVICFSGYEEYLRFAMFIQKSPLTLEYVAADKFLLDVMVKKLEKTEITMSGLECSIEMEALGTYYKIVEARNTQDFAGKIYSYVYPYTYSDFLSGSVNIQTETVLESPATLTIWGPCSNPAWAHYVNGTLVTRGKINIEVSNGRKLVISTRNIPWSIKEYDLNNNLIADRYKNSDFATARFVNLQHGENKIVFTHEGIENIKVMVEAMILYEAV